MVRLSSRQYSALGYMVNGEISVEDAVTLFQGTLGSFVYRKYVKFANGKFSLTNRGKQDFYAMASENIRRKQAGSWGSRVILVLPKTMQNGQ